MNIQAFLDVRLCGLVVADVSAERNASFFRVRRFPFMECVTVNVEVVQSCEMSVNIANRDGVTSQNILHTEIILLCPRGFPLFYSLILY